jgi:hypothetical protein
MPCAGVTGDSVYDADAVPRPAMLALNWSSRQRGVVAKPRFNMSGWNDPAVSLCANFELGN